MNRQAIIGLGVTGYSLLKFLAREGATNLVVVDTREHPPMLEAAQRDFAQVEYVCGRSSRYMAWHDVTRVHVSPGVALDSCLLAIPTRLGIPMDSDIGIFLRNAQAPVFAVTGTNGKSTVCSLAAHLMRAVGVRVGLGGNLGHPALDLLSELAPLYLLELSSFQLERLAGESVHMGAILNVAPDHADRYKSFDEYRSAKLRIAQDAEVSLENRQDPLTATSSARMRLSFGLDAPVGERDGGILDGDWLSVGAHRVGQVKQLQLMGKHGCANALAALVLANEAGADLIQAAEHLSSFNGLAHRSQLVGVYDGVRWIDDSKATNLAAALATVDGLSLSASEGGLVWILGGDAKGVDLAPLKQAIGPEVRGICVMGKDAERFSEAVDEATEVLRAETMGEAVYLCSKLARSGDTVLLSPAAASLDMFEDYQARGRAFASAVDSLKS